MCREGWILLSALGGGWGFLVVGCRGLRFLLRALLLWRFAYCRSLLPRTCISAVRVPFGESPCGDILWLYGVFVLRKFVPRCLFVADSGFAVLVFPVFGAVAVVGAADFGAAFWSMPHPESLPDFSQIALWSHSFFQCEFSVLLRCLPTSCVAAVPGPIKIGKIFLTCRQEYLANFSWCLPHCHITACNCM